MKQTCFKLTDEMKSEFQKILKRRAENATDILREWVQNYIDEYKESEEMIITIKRTKGNEIVQGIDYIDEYELNNTAKLAKNEINHILLEYNESIEHENEDVNKEIQRILNLELGEVILKTNDYVFHIKSESLDETLYGLYKKLDTFIDLTTLGYIDIRFSYYLNLDGRFIILTKEGEELKEWKDNATEHDIVDFLKSIKLDSFIKGIEHSE